MYHLPDEFLGHPMKDVDVSDNWVKPKMRIARLDGFGQPFKDLFLSQPSCPEFETNMRQNLILNVWRQLVPLCKLQGCGD